MATPDHPVLNEEERNAVIDLIIRALLVPHEYLLDVFKDVEQRRTLVDYAKIADELGFDRPSRDHYVVDDSRPLRRVLRQWQQAANGVDLEEWTTCRGILARLGEDPPEAVVVVAPRDVAGEPSASEADMSIWRWSEVGSRSWCVNPDGGEIFAVLAWRDGDIGELDRVGGEPAVAPRGWFLTYVHEPGHSHYVTGRPDEDEAADAAASMLNQAWGGQ